WLRRVAVVFQPRLEFGPAPTKLDDGKLEVVGNADVEVRIRKGDRQRNSSGTPHVLRIRKRDVGHFLMRYALSPSLEVFEDRNNKDIRAADLASINQWFATTFGRPSKVVAL
ncbi:MAG TPA: hypothetical protein VFG69_10390, partial [Nannocystaceae bacterium]|nr:hypothetical protein [Nannocystaceae bacterium]